MASDVKVPKGSRGDDGEENVEKLSPEEEVAGAAHHAKLSVELTLLYLQSMLTESNTYKTEANSLFLSGKYDAAINKYDEAIAVCPSYLDYELAVLRSNVAACHLKLEEWKEAVNNATAALDGLEKLEVIEKENQKQAEEDEIVELEIVSQGAAAAGPALPDHSKEEAEAARKKLAEDIARIRAKALMRRARARSELGGWSNLEGGIEDYKKLATMEANLGAADKKLVQAQLLALPPRAKAAQEKETTEMWEKLKDLGNGLLKPFGLSTDNFKMVKDEKTGGYSMNFESGNKGKN